jgi:hypothetical protein
MSLDRDRGVDHLHHCGAECGALISCPTPDCWVPDDWLCPACEMRMRDEYFQALELDYLNPNQPEPTVTDRQQE